MPAQRTSMSACLAPGQSSDAPELPTYTRQLSAASARFASTPDGHSHTTPADLRPVPTRTTAPDLSTLTISEIRVLVYVSGYERRYDDLVSPMSSIGRLTRALIGAADQIGLDTVRAIAAVLEYAELHHDRATLARLFPDRKSWDYTHGAAAVYRRYVTGRAFDPMIVDELVDQLAATNLAVAA